MRVRVNVRVIYGDTDAMGIVYHGNYLRWFEVGRTELFRTLGIVYRDLEARGYYLPLTKAYCHYHAPARYDDILVIETSIADWGRASIRFDYVVWDEGGEAPCGRVYPSRIHQRRGPCGQGPHGNHRPDPGRLRAVERSGRRKGKMKWRRN